MNVYEKIQIVKGELLKLNLKKTGTNKFSNFNYYELSDFLPSIVKLCSDNKLFSKIDFTKDEAKLTIINTEKNDEIVEYTSPTEELELKGCNKIQALGGTQTYLRRYLYMNAFDIVENDMFDAVSGKNDKTVSNSKTKNVMPNEDVLNKKMSSGKYVGKTLLEICAIDMRYIDWLINTKDYELAKKAKEQYEKSQVIITDEEFENLK